MEDLYSKNHSHFILSPIVKILQDVTSGSFGIGQGIETYPLCDYIMQSAYLKMTGAQEQKMKCICWELATNNYEYRYKRFTQKRLGECSSYDEKKTVFQDLINEIEKYTSKEFDFDSIEKQKILSRIELVINDIFNDSTLLIWAQKSFNDYKEIWKEVVPNYFATDKNTLFSTLSNKYSLRQMYDHLKRRRDRVAHNTLSYQQNLPTLRTLEKDDFKYENYFIYFSILILIDEIMIKLYKKYLKTFEQY